MEKPLASIKALGTARVAGLVCNKNADDIILTIDLRVPMAQLDGALEALGLEPSRKLLDALETALGQLRKRGPGI